MLPRPLSEALKEANDPELLEAHPLGRYIVAFADRPDILVTNLLGFGADSIAFEMPDGNVVKVGARLLFEEAGHRSFDLPILDHGEIPERGLRIVHYTQPLARTPVSTNDLERFEAWIARRGFVMSDPKISQLGFYEGKVLLLDPWAVQRRG